MYFKLLTKEEMSLAWLLGRDKEQRKDTYKHLKSAVLLWPVFKYKVGFLSSV